MELSGVYQLPASCMDSTSLFAHSSTFIEEIKPNKQTWMKLDLICCIALEELTDVLSG